MWGIPEEHRYEDPVGRVYVGNWKFRKHFGDMPGLGHDGESVFWGSVLKQGGDEEGDYKVLVSISLQRLHSLGDGKNKRTDQSEGQNRTMDGLVVGKCCRSSGISLARWTWKKRSGHSQSAAGSSWTLQDTASGKLLSIFSSDIFRSFPSDVKSWHHPFRSPSWSLVLFWFPFCFGSYPPSLHLNTHLFFFFYEVTLTNRYLKVCLFLFCLVICLNSHFSWSFLPIWLTFSLIVFCFVFHRTT